MTFLTWVGRNASKILLLGMVVIACLPGLSAALRPILPLLVSLLLGLAIARVDVRGALVDCTAPRHLAILMGLVALFLPLSCAFFVGLGHFFGAGPDTLLALAVFGAAPPLSSAASLALLMGYDARLTLQLGLLCTLLLPLVGPACLTFVGISVDVALLDMGLRIAGMIAGGFAIGLGLQRVIGKARINANAEAFNGLAAIAMLLFLFPLFDGVSGFMFESPGQAFLLFVLALLLNLGSHIMVRFGAVQVTARDKASALGLMWGNRNVSFYLAVLPANPAFGFFIAAAQIPIYATPAIFGVRK